MGSVLGSEYGIDPIAAKIGKYSATLGAGISPALGIGLGMFGGVAVDKAMDALGVRERESLRDTFEDRGIDTNVNDIGARTPGNYDAAAKALDGIMGVDNRGKSSPGGGFNGSSLEGTEGPSMGSVGMGRYGGTAGQSGNGNSGGGLGGSGGRADNAGDSSPGGIGGY